MGKSTCRWPGCEKPSRRSPWCSLHHRHAIESGIAGKRNPCKWSECGKFASARGFCINHYARASRLGDFESPWEKDLSQTEPPACRWPECGRPSKYRESALCGRCYQRARKLGDFETPWITWAEQQAPKPRAECRWIDCSRDAEYAGYCSRDYSRARRVGNLEDPWVDWITSGTCEVCGKTWENARNRNKRVCSSTCHVKAWALDNPEEARALKMDAVRRRRAKLAGVKVDHFSIEDLRSKHGDDCYLCGHIIDYDLKFPDPGSMSVDHITPISAGGDHSIENCAVTHLRCNLKKHAKPIWEALAGSSGEAA